MRRLYLMRHADAVAGTPDRERALSAAGLRDAARMGTRLRARGIRPGRSLISPATRCRQTFDALGLPDPDMVEIVDALYLASPETMLGLIGNSDETVSSVFLLAHDPGLLDLASWLLGDDNRLAGFPTSSVVALDLSRPWNRLDQPGLVVLQDILR